MTAWEATYDGDRSDDGYGLPAWRREFVAVGGEFVCLGALAGHCSGCWRGALSAACAEGDGGGKVRDLDGCFCGSGGAASNACLFVAGRGWDGRRTWRRGACGCALELCDCGSMVDRLFGARNPTRDERGAVAWDLEEGGAG